MSRRASACCEATPQRTGGAWRSCSQDRQGPGAGARGGRSVSWAARRPLTETGSPENAVPLNLRSQAMRAKMGDRRKQESICTGRLASGTPLVRCAFRICGASMPGDGGARRCSSCSTALREEKRGAGRAPSVSPCRCCRGRPAVPTPGGQAKIAASPWRLARGGRLALALIWHSAKRPAVAAGIRNVRWCPTGTFCNQL
jgi:hypothetical protein